VRSFTAELGKGDSESRQGQPPKEAPARKPSIGAYTHMSLPSNQPVRKIAGKVMALKEACPYGIVVIGTSMGGLHALEVLLAGLPKNFPLPVAIAQHRHKTSDESLSAFLQRQCVLPLSEAEDKEVIEPGHVYLAPADYHLLVEAESVAQRDSAYRFALSTEAPVSYARLLVEAESVVQRDSAYRFALSTEAPVSYARPSIDVLFESAADAYGERALGVILTGASDDGSRGLASIKAKGGLALVQEPSTAESPLMPKSAIAAVAIDWILPLSDIAPLIVNLCYPALR